MLTLELPLALPPWTKLGKKLESLCRKALYEFEMLGEETSIAIALSGGKDSLTLLFLLHAISGRGFKPFKITAIHIEGSFSCGASLGENFLQKICDKLEVPLIKKTLMQDSQELECYSCSRSRRKAIFEAAKENGISTIAFGHHRDDSNATLLMNLLHKAEFAANLPKITLYDYGITIIRPLIFASEKEILHFAQNYGFKRMTCQCPVGQNSLRKKAQDLIDELEAIFPNTKENLHRAGLLYGSKKALSK